MYGVFPRKKRSGVGDCNRHSIWFHRDGRKEEKDRERERDREKERESETWRTGGEARERRAKKKVIFLGLPTKNFVFSSVEENLENCVCFLLCVKRNVHFVNTHF